MTMFKDGKRVVPKDSDKKKSDKKDKKDKK